MASKRPLVLDIALAAAGAVAAGACVLLLNRADSSSPSNTEVQQTSAPRQTVSPPATAPVASRARTFDDVARSMVRLSEFVGLCLCLLSHFCLVVLGCHPGSCVDG